jgi:hypothetical protein
MSCPTERRVEEERKIRIASADLTDRRLEKLETNDQDAARIEFDVKKEHRSRVEADHNLGNRIKDNSDRICYASRDRIAGDQLLEDKLNAVSAKLEDFESKTTRSRSYAEIQGFQHQISVLMCANEKLNMQIGILNTCNGKQAQLIGKFRKLGRQMCDCKLSVHESKVLMRRLM